MTVQPVILVLARRMCRDVPDELKEPLTQNRLFIFLFCRHGAFGRFYTWLVQMMLQLCMMNVEMNAVTTVRMKLPSFSALGIRKSFML